MIDYSDPKYTIDFAPIPRIEEDIAEKITTDIFIPQEDVEVVEVEIYENGERFWDACFLLYKKTIEAHGLKLKYKTYSEHDFSAKAEQLYQIANGAVTAKLYREYREKYHWDIVFPR